MKKLNDRFSLARLSKFRFIFLIIPIVLQPFTSALIKHFAQGISEYSFSSIFFDWMYYLILFLFAMRIFFWQIALSFYELSLAYPIQSIRYILLIGISYFIFNEPISLFNILGALIISYGVISIYKS